AASSEIANRSPAPVSAPLPAPLFLSGSAAPLRQAIPLPARSRRRFWPAPLFSRWDYFSVPRLWLDPRVSGSARASSLLRCTHASAFSLSPLSVPAPLSPLPPHPAYLAPAPQPRTTLPATRPQRPTAAFSRRFSGGPGYLCSAASTRTHSCRASHSPGGHGRSTW